MEVDGSDVFLFLLRGILAGWTFVVDQERRDGGRELPQGYSSKTFPVSVDWPRRVGFVGKKERRRIRFCLIWVQMT